MSNSPYLPHEVKKYLKEHKIEDLVDDSVNELLRKKSDDPYSYLMNYFSKVI